VTDRLPHPNVNTHGDGHGDLLLDRILTELEGLRDDIAARFPLPADPVEESPEPDAKPEGGVPVEIREPATVSPDDSAVRPVTVKEPAKKTTPRKRAAKPSPDKES
jgi:hypothetical protein